MRIHPPFALTLALSFLLLTHSGCKPDVTCEGAPSNNPYQCAEDHPDRWYWIEIPGMQCRDGSQTGFGVRLQAGANKLLIYLQGGGACYDAPRCDGNPSKFNVDDFAGFAGFGGKIGVFNTGNEDNPFADWHMIYVPYCTGDLHWGNSPNTDVPGGPAGQDFIGYQNMSLVLGEIGPYFNTVTDVLLCGSSAGGLGTLVNYPQTAAAFPASTVTLIDDSGPLMEQDVAMTPCYQAQFRSLWGLAGTLPPTCPDCFSNSGDSLAQIFPWLSTTYPNAKFGLITSQQDFVIRDFYGDGQNNCTSTSSLSVPDFQIGLNYQLDSVLIPQGNWGTFVPGGQGHVFLSTSDFFSTKISGKTVAQWAEDLTNGTVTNLRE
ncbi:MAG: hypothetical protein H6581_14920 [Bacteroidia bacterium]|nr:hypothetical protein [Bacteroidia bacterium]